MVKVYIASLLSVIILSLTDETRALNCAGCPCTEKNGIIEVNCADRNLAQVPTFIAAIARRIGTLNLNKNRIVNIRSNTFRNFDKLSHLNLADNRIDFIYNNAFTGITYKNNLTTLDLSGNQLHTITAGLRQSDFPRASLRLTSNPLRCECDVKLLIQQLYLKYQRVVLNYFDRCTTIGSCAKCNDGTPVEDRNCKLYKTSMKLRQAFKSGFRNPNSQEFYLKATEISDRVKSGLPPSLPLHAIGVRELTNGSNGIIEAHINISILAARPRDATSASGIANDLKSANDKGRFDKLNAVYGQTFDVRVFALNCTEQPCDTNAVCEDTANKDSLVTCVCYCGYTGDGMKCTRGSAAPTYIDGKTYLIRNQCAIPKTAAAGTMGTLLATVSLGKLYRIEFEFLASVLNGESTVLHLMAGDDKEYDGKYGQQYPLVRFFTEKKKVTVCSAVSGNDQCDLDNSNVEKNRWTEVIIRQRNFNSRLAYTVQVGNKVLTDVENTDAREFRDVRVYIGSPWFSGNLPGYIRELSVVEAPCGDTAYMLNGTCVPVQVYETSLRLSGNFRNEYNDVTSKAFVDKAAKIEKEVEKALNNDYIEYVEVMKLTSGSVVAQVQLSIKQSAPRNATSALGMAASLKEANRNGQLSSIDAVAGQSFPVTVLENIWSLWSPWSSCSKSCGNGDKSRQRTCMYATSSKCALPGGTVRSLLPHVEEDTCNDGKCGTGAVTTTASLPPPPPTTPIPSEWDSWSLCSTSCGPGTQTRQCVTNKPRTCLINGVRSTVQTQDCIAQDCAVKSSAAIETWLIVVIVVVAVLLIVVIAIIVWCCKRKRIYYNPELQPNKKFRLDPDRSLMEQVKDLPYDIAWEFPRKDLNFQATLGEGNFGKVWHAKARGMDAFKPRDKGDIHVRANIVKLQETAEESQQFSQLAKMTAGTIGRSQMDAISDVAVKTLKDCATSEHYSDLASEIKILIQLGPHPNIVNLLGSCTIKGGLWSIMEYCEHGSLLDFLRKREHYFVTEWTKNSPSLLDGVCFYDLLKMALQILKGMIFLHSNQVVHRDLAARNILIDGDFTMKIADFGLARPNEYVKETDDIMPIKWSALEALLHHKYDTKTDVWSFGILLWEMFSCGEVPYPSMKSQNVVKFLKDGNRMDAPDNCPEEVYNIMRECWETEPTARPGMPQLHRELDAVLLSVSTGPSSEYYEGVNIADHDGDNDSDHSESDVSLPVSASDESEGETNKGYHNYDEVEMTGSRKDTKKSGNKHADASV